MDSLSASIEKLQRKAKAIGEVDAKIAGELQDEEELEIDVFEAAEIQDGSTERVDQIKCFTSRQAKPKEPLPPSWISSQSSSLSATAQPFSSLNMVPNPSEDGQRIQNQRFFLSNDSHGSMASQTSHSVSRLPKLSYHPSVATPYPGRHSGILLVRLWTPSLFCQEYRSLII